MLMDHQTENSSWTRKKPELLPQKFLKPTKVSRELPRPSTSPPISQEPSPTSMLTKTDSSESKLCHNSWNSWPLIKPSTSNEQLIDLIILDLQSKDTEQEFKEVCNLKSLYLEKYYKIFKNNFYLNQSWFHSFIYFNLIILIIMPPLVTYFEQNFIYIIKCSSVNFL